MEQLHLRLSNDDLRSFPRCTTNPVLEQLRLDFTTSVCLDQYTKEEVMALERDLERVASMQRHLFPCCVPELENLQVAAHLKPAGIVSGDFFDFYRYGETGQGMLIADIMGKGLPASMLMANMQASVRVLGPENQGVEQLVTRLNTLFKDHVKTGAFISMVALAYDPDSGDIQYCNAGHLPPLLWCAQTQTVEWLKPTGPALGLVNGPGYGAGRIEMNPGDVLVLYTDGLVEARNIQGEEFEESRLAGFIADHHEKPAWQIIADLHRALEVFTGGGFRDDLSLMVLKWT